MRVRNPLYVKLGFVLLIIGLVGLALPFISFGLSEDYVLLQKVAEQKQEQNFQDQYINQTFPILSPTSSDQQNRGSSISKSNQNDLKEIGTTARLDPNLVNISNRLVIPGIKVDMPLFESTNASILLKGGWVFPSTSTPDQGHNTVIFGHRFRFLPPITNTFYSLDKVQIGDTFTVAWKGVIYSYKITEKKIIEPTDFSVLNQTSESEITLITCAPLFSTKQRLVIVGTLIK